MPTCMCASTQPGKANSRLASNDFVGILGADFRREPRHLAVLDADVETVHAGLVRPDDAGVLDDQIEYFHLQLLTFLTTEIASTARAILMISSPARRAAGVRLVPA